MKDIFRFIRWILTRPILAFFAFIGSYSFILFSDYLVAVEEINMRVLVAMLISFCVAVVVMLIQNIFY